MITLGPGPWRGVWTRTISARRRSWKIAAVDPDVDRITQLVGCRAEARRTWLRCLHLRLAAVPPPPGRWGLGTPPATHIAKSISRAQAHTSLSCMYPHWQSCTTSARPQAKAHSTAVHGAQGCGSCSHAHRCTYTSCALPLAALPPRRVVIAVPVTDERMRSAHRSLGAASRSHRTRATAIPAACCRLVELIPVALLDDRNGSALKRTCGSVVHLRLMPSVVGDRTGERLM